MEYLGGFVLKKSPARQTAQSVLTRRHEVTTKFTIKLGESIVTFVEYLGGFVLKKSHAVFLTIEDDLPAKIIKKSACHSSAMSFSTQSTRR